MKIPVIMNWNKLLPFIVTSLFVVIYGFNAPTHPVGYADSSEIIVAGFFNTVTHPPGYSLITSLLYLLKPLTEHITPAHLANLTSATLQAISLGFLFASIKILIYLFYYRDTNQKTAHNLLSFSSLVPLTITFLLGFSSLYWLYSGIIEVIQLANVLYAAALFFSLKAYHQLTIRPSQSLPKSYWISILLYGVLLSQFQPAILVLPGLAVISWLSLNKAYRAFKNLTKPASVSVGLFILGFAIPSIILMSQNQNPHGYPSWSFDQSLSGLIHHLTRQDYAGYFPSQDIERPAYFVSFHDRLLSVQPQYLQQLLSHLGVAFFILSITGLVILIKNSAKYLKELVYSIKHKTSVIKAIPGNTNQALGFAILLLFIISGPIFTARLGYPEPSSGGSFGHLMDLGVQHRQFFLGYISLALIAAIGLQFVIDKYKQSYAFSISHDRLTRLATDPKILIPVIAIIVISLQVYSNRSVLELQSQQTVYQHSINLLESADPDSLIICGSDISCYGLYHAHFVQGIRPDVFVTGTVYPYAKDYLFSHPNLYPFSHFESPFYEATLISYNLTQRSVYLTDPRDYLIEHMGLRGDPFYLVPKQGQLFQIVTDLDSVSPDFDSRIAKNLFQTPVIKNDSFGQGLPQYFADIHQLSGALSLYSGEISIARNHFETALTLNPNYQPPIMGLGLLEDQSLRYSPDQPNTSKDYLNNYQKAIDEDNPTEAYKNISKAVYIDPLNPEPRQTLIDFFNSTNNPHFAQIEQKNLTQITNLQETNPN